MTVVIVKKVDFSLAFSGALMCGLKNYANQIGGLVF